MADVTCKIYDKVLRVIESCKTIDQLTVAKNFMDLSLKYISGPVFMGLVQFMATIFVEKETELKYGVLERLRIEENRGAYWNDWNENG